MITSPGNERIKRAARLRRGTHRREEGLTLVDGARELAAAIQAGVAIREVFVCPELTDTTAEAALIEGVKQAGGQVFEVAPAVAERLAYGERHDGMTAVVVPPQRQLSDLELPERPLVAVLDGVEKPGNIGAVVRSADAAGVSAVIVADGGTDLYNPNVIRASLGTIFRVPVCAADNAELGAWLAKRNLQLIAARLDATAAPWDVDFAQPTAILLGSEASGLSAHWNGGTICGVRLPMLGAADSLNVSATAAVLFYESLRQRQSK